MIINIKNKSLHLSFRGAILFLVFIISIILGNLYIEGDQKTYIKIYNGIAGYNITDAYFFYIFNITSIEIIHFIIIWVASNLGIDKIIFMAMCNTLLTGLIIKFFDDMKVNFAITSFFILTNFYLYVLFFAAERLKFGIIFFFLSILYQEKFYHKISFFLLSILSHLQMLIVYSGKIFTIFLQELKHFLITFELKWSLLLLLPIAVVVFLFIQADLFIKILAYSDNRGWSDFLRILIFLMMALYYSKSKLNTFIYFIPLFIAVYFVGGDRVNMIGYMFFLYSALQYRGGFNIGILITTLYFFYINIDFVRKIILYGNGFNP